MNDMFEEVNTHLLALILRSQIEILNRLDSRPLLVAKPPSPVPMRVATPPSQKEDNNR